LHPKGGTCSFNHSHIASLKGDLVRARSVYKHRALPVNKNQPLASSS
jgi:hypothetical protein